MSAYDAAAGVSCMKKIAAATSSLSAGILCQKLLRFRHFIAMMYLPGTTEMLAYRGTQVLYVNDAGLCIPVLVIRGGETPTLRILSTGMEFTEVTYAKVATPNTWHTPEDCYYERPAHKTEGA
jgi:hypothetical protein